MGGEGGHGLGLSATEAVELVLRRLGDIRHSHGRLVSLDLDTEDADLLLDKIDQLTATLERIRTLARAIETGPALLSRTYVAATIDAALTLAPPDRKEDA
jgi:transposase